MISATGKGLTVVISTTPSMNWPTFGTWYSFYRNLPHAVLEIVCNRTGETPFELYQWAKKVHVPVRFRNTFGDQYDPSLDSLGSVQTAFEGKTASPTLVVQPYVMALSPISDKTLEAIRETPIWCDDEASYFAEPSSIEPIVDRGLIGDESSPLQGGLCCHAKDEESVRWLTSYRKGCGRWIDTAKGCPFSNAAGLVHLDMTANEIKINDLWKKMAALYSALCQS